MSVVMPPKVCEVYVEGIGKVGGPTHCGVCEKRYWDESGCDPCPFCGAGYFTQIFHDQL